VYSLETFIPLIKLGLERSIALCFCLENATTLAVPGKSSKNDKPDRMASPPFYGLTHLDASYPTLASTQKPLTIY
jgi:hypothetical protein